MKTPENINFIRKMLMDYNSTRKSNQIIRRNIEIAHSKELDELYYVFQVRGQMSEVMCFSAA
jgi:hypothetical protein